MFMNKNDIIYNFEGRTVLVVGGSRGIGLQVVKEFSAAGATVYCASRTAPPIQGVIHLQCDVTIEEQIEAVFSFISSMKGPLDFVINVAGTNLCEPISNITSGEWDRVLNTNLKSFFLVSRLAVGLMKKAKFGRIVNVSSIAGRHKSIVSGVHYTASKAGIIGLTKQLAHEVAPYNILVNCVCPSQTMTEMLEQSMTPAQITLLASKIPVRRIASTQEQAAPILFLCSSAANYMTGTTLDINGGQF